MNGNFVEDGGVDLKIRYICLLHEIKLNWEETVAKITNVT